MRVPEDLPSLNAVLNSLSAVLLTLGYVMIRRQRVAAHKALMLAAFGVSTLFLASYLTYHYQVGSKRFEHPGFVRQVYLAILISHTVLAAAVVPLVLVTLYGAARGQFARHRRIARWTLPIWLYVSVSGVIVYLMLYQLFPSPASEERSRIRRPDGARHGIPTALGLGRVNIPRVSSTGLGGDDGKTSKRGMRIAERRARRTSRDRKSGASWRGTGNAEATSAPRGDVTGSAGRPCPAVAPATRGGWPGAPHPWD